ncbi:MAG: YbhB/YbcL family Raf kinase inhibitor-like protein [Corynebacteriales bacterium]|nr:YbhB/YbcL family Raf kinase inhibitor-like protein [Mycobacteriales bacterium]
MPNTPYDALPQVPSFQLESDDIVDGVQLDYNQVAAGGNLSPHLRWSGFPEDTTGFVITCYDPDAPTGSGWWHWMLWNIPADVTEIAPGERPEGSFQLRNDDGEHDYTGAAPPPGQTHRYFFAVHALGEEIKGVDEDTTPGKAGFKLTAATIARAVLVPVYSN